MDDSSGRILDELPLGVWVGCVPEGRVLYANRAFREILGMAAVEGSRLGDIPATYRVFDRGGQAFPIERLPFSQVVASGQSVVVEGMVIHRADGARVPIRAFGQPLRDGQGRMGHVIVAFIDVSREVLVEAERDTIVAQLKLAVDHAPVALFSIDPEGIITMSEGAGLKALGVRSGDLVGQSIWNLYRDHPTIPGYIRKGLAGEALYYTVQVGEAVFDSWLTPIRGEDGVVTGVLGLAHDMSELRHLQAAAIQSDRVMAMGTLAASVAHEVNNPLTYVLAHLYSLRRGLDRHLTRLAGQPELAAAASEMIEDLIPAYQGVQRIATIIRDLRTFARADDGRLEPIDVRPVIESVVKLVRKDVELRARLRVWLPAVPAVVASETRLAQVLLNLLINAQQSLPDGDSDLQEVAVVLRDEGTVVAIEVSDSGPGIPESERERVFEAFVSRRPTGEGTGLGLFVCRNIVRGLGGEISVHERAGGGAIFRVEVPAAGRTAASRPPPPPGPAPPAGRRPRVLLIDDEPLVAKALSGQLAEAGFDTEVVPDAASASSLLLGDAAFDLVYCDLMMKGMSGMDLADVLADRAPHRLTRVVFMTGGAFTDWAADFLVSHADDCVEKPFDVVGETHRRLRALAPDR